MLQNFVPNPVSDLSTYENHAGIWRPKRKTGRRAMPHMHEKTGTCCQTYSASLRTLFAWIGIPDGSTSGSDTYIFDHRMRDAVQFTEPDVLPYRMNWGGFLVRVE